MSKKALIAVLALGLAGGVAMAEEPTKWLNINVVEHGDGGATVDVRVPMSLVLAVIEAVDVEGFSDGHVDLDLDDADIDWPVLVKAIQDAPDAEYVRVKSDTENVVIRKQQGMVLIHVTEGADAGEEVEVTVPVELLEAVSTDEEHRLDMRSVLARLDQGSLGDIVRVKSSDADVRVWIE